MQKIIQNKYLKVLLIPLLLCLWFFGSSFTPFPNYTPSGTYSITFSAYRTGEQSGKSQIRLVVSNISGNSDTISGHLLVPRLDGLPYAIPFSSSSYDTVMYLPYFYQTTDTYYGSFIFSGTNILIVDYIDTKLPSSTVYQNDAFMIPFSGLGTDPVTHTVSFKYAFVEDYNKPVYSSVSSVIRSSTCQLVSLSNDSFSSTFSASELSYSSGSITKIGSNDSVTSAYLDLEIPDDSTQLIRFNFYLTQFISSSDFSVIYTFPNMPVNEQSQIRLFSSSSSSSTPIFSARLQDFSAGEVVLPSGLSIDFIQLVISPMALSGDSSLLFHSSEYNSGYNDGYNNGYDEGKTEGTENGYESGYQQGNQAGYNEGYNAALSADSPFVAVINAVISAPFTFAKQALDFDFFGLNLLSISYSLIAISVLAFIIKKLI